MRRAAILLLIVFAACKQKPSIPALRQALKDKDVKVQRAAVLDLGHTGDPGVVDDLLKAAGKGFDKEAVAALAELGAAAESRLLASLDRGNALDAAYAARALGAMHSTKAAQTMMQRMQSAD